MKPRASLSGRCPVGGREAGAAVCQEFQPFPTYDGFVVKDPEGRWTAFAARARILVVEGLGFAAAGAQREAALAGAAHVIEGTYETGAQEHVYLETNGMEAWEENGVVTVRGLDCVDGTPLLDIKPHRCPHGGKAG